MNNNQQTNNNHHKPKIKLVQGADYNNPTGWWTLHDFIKQHVEHSDVGEYDPQWLNWMIQLDLQPNGFTTGVEDAETGELKCLLVAEWIHNMWVRQRDCVVVGILKRKHCEAKYIDLMLHQLEYWARDNDCKTISINTWDARKGYIHWAKRKGYNLRGYTVAKDLK